MSPGLEASPLRSPRWWVVLILGLLFADAVCAQTASTGAVIGLTLDPSGAVVPDVTVKLVNRKIGEALSATSDENGRFAFLLLPPGAYELRANKTNFRSVILEDLHVNVTETLRFEVHLELATRFESTQVSSDSLTIQLDSSSLGRALNQEAVGNLPLVTRNFAQITGLSSGVSVGVYNAGELGLGGIALSQISPSNDGVYVHGARSYDNNYELDGISVSDVQGSAAGSGGIPFRTPTRFRSSRFRPRSTTRGLADMEVPTSA